MFSGVKDPEKIAHMRRQQIDSIKIFNDRVTEVTEGSEYKVEFNANGTNFNVVITLSKDFPLEKPILKVEPTVSHAWVNPSNSEIFAAPGLLKFTIHSELGRVVQAIVREFELRPPPIIDGYQKDNRQIENSNDNSVSTNVGASNGDTSLLSNLNSLSIENLQKLNTEPDKLEELITNLPILVDLNKSLDDELSKIESLALENLDRENELITLKYEVNTLTLQLSEKYDQYQKLTLDYSKQCEKFNPHSIRESLVNSIARIDEESERIAENFLNGDIDLEKFLLDYSSHRFISHSRKFKAENLGQQLNKLHLSRF